MNKIVSTGAAVMMTICASPLQSMAGHWYVGGTLFNITVREWQKSSHENKLATAANWTLMQPSIRKISQKNSTMETVRPYAIEPVACVDQVTVEDSYADKKVSSLGAACMVSWACKKTRQA
jgi:hypothetical protein